MRDDDDIDDDAEELKIPYHAFRYSHRKRMSSRLHDGRESMWRNTLDHFDAIKIRPISGGPRPSTASAC
jgi:type I restriction enzyme, R subunit